MVNISGIALSETEINLLSKGFSFCPTPHHIKKEEILDDLRSYFRYLHLKEVFFLKEAGEDHNDAQT